MSYQYITDRNSPNFTPGSQAQATWGRPRTVEAIAIHWWGDPNQNPSAEGIVNYLCSTAAGVSAHFVVTGTGRRAWQLVNFSDASWATNSANPYTISIECDPRCREEDYDTIAEVISQIRDAYGANLPLVPHKQFTSTACPGNYNLAELDRRARTKDGSGDWGTVKSNIPTPPPAPSVPVWSRMDNPRTMRTKQDLHTWDLVNKKEVGDVIRKGTPVEFETKTTWNGIEYLRTKYSTGKGFNYGIDLVRVEDIPVPEVVTPPVVTPTPETPPKPIEETPKPSEPESGTSKPNDTEVALEELIRALKRFFDIVSRLWKS